MKPGRPVTSAVDRKTAGTFADGILFPCKNRPTALNGVIPSYLLIRSRHACREGLLEAIEKLPSHPSRADGQADGITAT